MSGGGGVCGRGPVWGGGAAASTHEAKQTGKLLKLRQQRDADGVSPLLLPDSGPLFPLRATFSFIP